MPAQTYPIVRGRRLKLIESCRVGIKWTQGTLEKAGYEISPRTPITLHPQGSAEVPAGAGLIVTSDTDFNLSGWLIWRDTVTGVHAAHAGGLDPQSFASVRGKMRLPGESLPSLSR